MLRVLFEHSAVGSDLESKVEGRADHSRLLQRQLGLDLIASRIGIPANEGRPKSETNVKLFIVREGIFHRRPCEEHVCFVL